MILLDVLSLFLIYLPRGVRSASNNKRIRVRQILCVKIVYLVSDVFETQVVYKFQKGTNFKIEADLISELFLGEEIGDSGASWK